MSCPRLEIDYARIGHNTRTLVQRTGSVGIGVTGITKVMRGDPRLAATMLDSGVDGVGESRIENIERLRAGRIEGLSGPGGDGRGSPVLLVRSPMPSQVERVVAGADISCNTEPEVMRLLSDAAVGQGLVHGVIVMVELGDLREGVLAEDVVSTVAVALALPGVRVRGIGTNLACRNGVVPDGTKMAELSGLADDVETRLGIELDYVSGGNSANLGWLLAGGTPGRVNNLRLGEAILLGREPLERRPIDGLHTDAVVLVGEVIESLRKPRIPWGSTAQAAFGSVEAGSARPGEGRSRWQTIVALGHQDIDPAGLVPLGEERILGASSDHLVIETAERLPPGHEVRFAVDYGALLRAMTSPYVSVAEAGNGRDTARRVASRRVA